MKALREKLFLMKGLLNGEHAFAGPFFVTVDITRRCNLHCLGCQYHSTEIESTSGIETGDQDLSIELFEILCEDLKKMGTKSMVLTGDGEPLLHPDLLDFIIMAKDAGLSVELFTNGTLLNEERIRDLAISGLDRIKISLWGATLEDYMDTHPGTNPAYFDKVISSIRYFADHKKMKASERPVINVHYPINRLNFEKIGAMVELAADTRIDSLTFSPFKTRRGRLSHISLSAEQQARLYPVMKSAKRHLKSLSIEHNISNLLLRYRIGEEVWLKIPCYMAWLHARIKVDGSVKPCNSCDISMGNLHRCNMKKIWNDKNFRVFRRRTSDKKGLHMMASHCDCLFCCHVVENYRVHRIRMLFPLHHKDNGKGIFD